MFRTFRFARLLCALAVVSLAPNLAPAAEKSAHPLPIRRVVLFTSGVAFVEHRGEVEGNAQVDFQFHVDDINDLLKSMVVQDEGGGRVETVTYAPQERLEITLGNLRVDPSRVRTLGDLLGQLRGERVQLEIPTVLTGTIIAVDRSTIGSGDKLSVSETLLLKTDAGLRSLPLSSIASVKLLNEALDRDLQTALELLATAHGGDTKQVSLKLRGEGKRQVRVGYIQEFPVWKTSYRLVLDEKEPLLQGWAIVENTTEHDWKDVDLALVSGRPVSFTMDLYAPLFLQRPLVVPEILAGLRPRVHAEDQLAADARFRAQAGGLGMGGMGGMGGGFGGGGFGGSGGGFGGGMGGSGPSVTSVVPVVDGAGPASMNPVTSMVAAASGGDVGASFRYQIQHPVTLAKQKSALLPIVNDPVKVERVEVFNAKVHAKHPLAAFELTNNTKLHLMAGPLTIFDGGEYAGDAQIGHFAPGVKRLISYALDLKVSVNDNDESRQEDPFGKQPTIDITIENGAVRAKQREEREQVYVVKNSHADPRRVLIEHPRDASWKVITPENPTEETDELLRYAVAAKPGEPAELKVVEERITHTRVALFQEDGANPLAKLPLAPAPAAFSLALTATNPSPALREALQQWRTKAEAVETANAAVKAADLRREEITQDQARIRQNIGAVPEGSDLQQRYLKTLSDQEDELLRMRDARVELEAAVAARTKELADFLRKLEVK